MQAVWTGSAAVLAVVIAAFAFMPEVRGQNPWMVDRRLAGELRDMGVQKETDNAIVFFEGGALSEDAMTEFAGLVQKGIHDIASYLGVPVPDQKIRYYISNQIGISHSRGRSIYLPLSRVANKSAPYLHETTHALAPCEDCPTWFSEGLASYVQSYISEHVGGYDGVIFAPRGNRGVDGDATRWLANDRGQAVLPFIAQQEEPPQINYDRSNVAAPYYVMAQSLVKHMFETTGMEKMRGVMSAHDFDSGLERFTGRTAQQWKEAWLEQLRS